MRKLISLVGLAIALLGCTDKNIVFEGNTILSNDSWERKQPQKFSFEIKDTLAEYELSYMIRNIHSYSYCNLYLKYTLTDTTDKIISNNFQDIYLYNPKSGDPLGDKEMLNDAQTGKYPFARVKFPKEGNYTLSVIHQMRDSENLEGLESIGLQVKKQPL